MNWCFEMSKRQKKKTFWREMEKLWDELPKIRFGNRRRRLIAQMRYREHVKNHGARRREDKWK